MSLVCTYVFSHRLSTPKIVLFLETEGGQAEGLEARKTVWRPGRETGGKTDSLEANQRIREASKRLWEAKQRVREASQRAWEARGPDGQPEGLGGQPEGLEACLGRGATRELEKCRNRET